MCKFSIINIFSFEKDYLIYIYIYIFRSKIKNKKRNQSKPISSKKLNNEKKLNGFYN